MKHILDARNLLCPLPVIRVQERVSEIPDGEMLEVICTDPGVIHDFPSWCRLNGHNFVDFIKQDDEYIVHLEVKRGSNVGP